MKREPGTRLDLLLSPAFLVGLTVLLVNDFVLKDALHNAVTGKLSDFAGLFVFPMFWAALAPRRAPAIYVVTAIAFVVWKSPLSQPAIDGWNAAGFAPVGRVVDVTDLVALVMLAISYGYVTRARHTLRLRAAPRLTISAVLLLSLLAFTATSSLRDEIYITTFDDVGDSNVTAIARPPDSVIASLEQLKLVKKPPFGNLYEIVISTPECKSRKSSGTTELRAFIEDDGGGGTRVILHEARHGCPDTFTKPVLLELFRTKVIDRLSEETRSIARPPYSLFAITPRTLPG